MFIDDDCDVGEHFAEDMRTVLEAHPDAAFVSPYVDAPDDGTTDGLLVTTFTVAEDRPSRR